MGLTQKQQVFVDQYLVDFNATRAAICAGYSKRSARSIGCENLTKPDIVQAIQEKIMSKDEVLVQLTDIARSDMGDFLTIGDESFYIDLFKAKENKKTHLIKKAKVRNTTVRARDGSVTETQEIEIELYNKQDAIVQMGKYHKLFVERQEITGADGGAIEVVYVKPTQEDD